MGAFIVAGLILLCTLGICGLMIFANGMVTAPKDDSSDVLTVLVIGTCIAAFVGATHFMPPVGW